MTHCKPVIFWAPVLSSGCFGSEVGLGGEDTAIGGFLAAASICKGVSRVSGGSSRIYVLAGLAPQAQVEPAGLAFSVAARSQVHSPAGRAPRVIVKATLGLVAAFLHNGSTNADAEGTRVEGAYGRSSGVPQQCSQSRPSRMCN